MSEKTKQYSSIQTSSQPTTLCKPKIF